MIRLVDRTLSQSCKTKCGTYADKSSIKQAMLTMFISSRAAAASKLLHAISTYLRSYISVLILLSSPCTKGLVKVWGWMYSTWISVRSVIETLG
jgi:hypothetical protein